MWTLLLFGGLAGIIASYARAILVEAITALFGIQQTSIFVNEQTPAYKRIKLHSVFGPSQVYISSLGVPLRYGFFIAPKLRCCGYITDPLRNENRDQYANIWAVGIDAIKNIITRDPTETDVYLCNYVSFNHGNWCLMRAPRTAHEWQANAVKTIMRTHSWAPDDALVCLITGKPGCGKSTIPLFVIRELNNASISIARYTKQECFARLGRMSGLSKTVIAIDDQIGEIINGVVNDKHQPVISMSEWNTNLDHVHGIKIGPIIILTSNVTYEDLIERAGEQGVAMLRPGRIDMILHVNSADAVEVQRERVAS